MTTKQLRDAYLNYFKQKDHAVIPSASVIPENDPTTLFTGSGMQPMVPYLLGQSHPQGTRIADSQKCIRTQDIEEVGDNRHTTFFEMLGNWSLGDYFKKEQISWMYHFVTKVVGLDPNNLYITCFRGYGDIPKDEEAALLWQQEFGNDGIVASIVDNPEKDGLTPGARIFFYDATKNWWSRAGVPENMPVGEPGGPDTEMFWDFGESASDCDENPCHVNCECGRFLEIGNNVFMQYKKTENGFEPLPQQNVDFGGGLERIAAAKNGDPDVFMIDLFRPIRDAIEDISGRVYGQHNEETYAFRVIMDHMRAATFMIADGAAPSNKDQGYFTRRMIRRAVRHASTLGIDTNFCARVAEAVIGAYDGAYPSLESSRDMILAEMTKEEEKFRKTLAEGLKVFESKVKNLKSKIISGKDAFDLYQSYGFPLEVTQELAEERGLTIDLDTFNTEMKAHQEKSRAGGAQKFKGGLADTSEMSVKYHTATHLLHAALQEVLGPHALQRGSNITPERLRFDFTHPEKMTPEQKTAVEELVNAAIKKDYPVTWQELSYEEAKARGSIGLFEDNYGDKVKVYSIGDERELPKADPIAATFSRELCGGPHVERTGMLGHFRIKKEESCSAGVRRIKAILE